MKKIAVAGAPGGSGAHSSRSSRARARGRSRCRARRRGRGHRRGSGGGTDGGGRIIDAATGPSPDQAGGDGVLHDGGAQPAGGRRAAGVRADGASCRSSASTSSTPATRPPSSPRSRPRWTGPVPARIAAGGAVPRVRRQLLEWGRQGDVAYVPADAHPAGGGPHGGRGARRPGHAPDSAPATGPTLEIAGPRAESLVELARLLAARRGDVAAHRGGERSVDPDSELYEAGAAAARPGREAGRPDVRGVAEGPAALAESAERARGPA